MRWDGERLQGNWSGESLIGTELYDHDGDEGTDFNRVEGVNDAAANPSVEEALSKQMREASGE